MVGGGTVIVPPLSDFTTEVCHEVSMEEKIRRYNASIAKLYIDGWRPSNWDPQLDAEYLKDLTVGQSD